MDFARTRGKRATARCTNVHPTWGSALYCDCGCQAPRSTDTYNLDGLSVRVVKSFKTYKALIRDGAIVGSIDRARDYVSLDGNEYLGVIAGSPLATVFNLPVSGDEKETIITAGSTPEETAANVASQERIDLAEMDSRNERRHGYCTKCHSFCYGDCDA